MFSAWLDRWHFLLRYIFLDDDQKISKLLIRKLFFNSDHFMDSILASMSILVKILLYRSQPTNSPIIPGLREINFLQHTMAAIMTAFLKWFPFTTERKFFSAPIIIGLKGWCSSQSEKNFLLIDNGNLSKKTVIDDCSHSML